MMMLVSRRTTGPFGPRDPLMLPTWSRAADIEHTGNPLPSQALMKRAPYYLQLGYASGTAVNSSIVS